MLSLVFEAISSDPGLDLVWRREVLKTSVRALRSVACEVCVLTVQTKHSGLQKQCGQSILIYFRYRQFVHSGESLT